MITDFIGLLFATIFILLLLALILSIGFALSVCVGYILALLKDKENWATRFVDIVNGRR